MEFDGSCPYDCVKIQFSLAQFNFKVPLHISETFFLVWVYVLGLGFWVQGLAGCLLCKILVIFTSMTMCNVKEGLKNAVTTSVTMYLLC